MTDPVVNSYPPGFEFEDIHPRVGVSIITEELFTHREVRFEIVANPDDELWVASYPTKPGAYLILSKRQVLTLLNDCVQQGLCFETAKIGDPGSYQLHCPAVMPYEKSENQTQADLC